MPVLGRQAVRQLRRHIRRVDKYMNDRPYRASVLGPYLMNNGTHRAAGGMGHDIKLGKPDSTHSSGNTQTYSIYELTTGGTPQDTGGNQTNVYQQSGFSYSTDVFCIIWEVDTADNDYKYWSWPIELEDCESAQPINLGSRSKLDISSGVITMTESFHKVETESLAATDDLDTINGGADGDILVIVANNSARTVVAKDGTGNLAMSGDFSLTHTQDNVGFIYNGTNWLEIFNNNNNA